MFGSKLNKFDRRDAHREIENVELSKGQIKDSEREQDIFGEAEREPKPEWLNAEEMFIKGQLARDERTEKLMNGLTETILDLSKRVAELEKGDHTNG